jgi:hypothetical protein
MPIQMPITVEKSVPRPTRSNVGPMRDQIVVETALALRRETPRFPVSVCPA